MRGTGPPKLLEHRDHRFRAPDWQIGDASCGAGIDGALAGRVVGTEATRQDAPIIWERRSSMAGLTLRSGVFLAPFHPIDEDPTLAL
ncbi:MAG TPA: hypothetical protein VKU84_01515, partial [Stellaceae bacterium]|nr:hypothetical protein [Stellaceae bacterium]